MPSLARVLAHTWKHAGPITVHMTTKGKPEVQQPPGKAAHGHHDGDLHDEQSRYTRPHARWANR